MARKSLIKIKQKPKKPVKKKSIRHSISIYAFCDSLSSLIDRVKEINPDQDLDEVYFEYAHGYEDDIDLYICFTAPELEKYYNERLESYNKRLDKYNKWYEKNKVLIEKELKLRDAEAMEKVKYEEKLEKELSKIQGKLEKIK